MKFSVGLKLYEGNKEKFSHIVEDYGDAVSEVFFSWQDVPNGRSAIATVHGYTDWNAQARLEEELRAIKKMDKKLDLLFNANCYGKDSISEKLANNVISVIEYLNESVGGVDIVTTTSPTVAHVLKSRFPEIEVRASVNMRIGTVKGMEYVSDLFDSYHVQRDYNRNLEHLSELKQWAESNGKKLIMLANSGCFSFCSGQTFHDNLVAHEAEICEMNNIKDFMPYVCWKCLKDQKNWHMLLQNTWVRPEDIHNYEGLFDTVKLATRMHESPGLVIGAYSRGYYYGNTLDLFEPGFGRAIEPYIINNSAFPVDFFERTSKCDKKCHKCNYCKTVLEKVLFNTEQFDDQI